MLLTKNVFLLTFVLLLTSKGYVTAQLNSEVPVGLATLLAVGGSSISLLLIHLEALRETDRIQAECTKTSSAKDACAKKLVEAADDLKKTKTDCDEQLRQRDSEKTAALAAQQQKCNDEKTVLTEDKKKSADALKKAKTDCDEQVRQRDAEKTAALAAQQQKCNDEKTVLTDDNNKLSSELEQAKKDFAKTIAENDTKFQTRLASEKAKCDSATKKCENEKTTLFTAKTKCDNDLAVCQLKAKKCSSYTGYTYDSPTRVCYKAITSGFSQRADAVAECNSNSGGRLIRVDNAQIQNLAKSVMASNSMRAT